MVIKDLMLVKDYMLELQNEMKKFVHGDTCINYVFCPRVCEIHELDLNTAFIWQLCYLINDIVDDLLQIEYNYNNGYDDNIEYNLKNIRNDNKIIRFVMICFEKHPEKYSKELELIRELEHLNVTAITIISSILNKM